MVAIKFKGKIPILNVLDQNLDLARWCHFNWNEASSTNCATRANQITLDTR